MKIFSYYNMEESPPSKKKRCPKGTRRNKEGICVPVHKSPPKSPPTPKSPPKLMQDDMPTETKPKRKLIVKKNTKNNTTQKQKEEDIVIPVGNTTKCPKGTRRNKEKQCILTKEFKDTFLKRKACIQAKRDELI